MKKPPSTKGLRHVALYVTHLEACETFYTALLDMTIIWKPDADNVYLTTGQDNIALHRAPANYDLAPQQRLDHIGFFLEKAAEVDEWHDYLRAQQVPIKAAPKDHRDGTRSFYCADPDGTLIQFIYYPL